MNNSKFQESFYVLIEDNVLQVNLKEVVLLKILGTRDTYIGKNYSLFFFFFGNCITG